MEYWRANRTSGTWALANVYLKKAGLDPEKDVELVSLGGDNAVFYTALQSGRVDAIASFEPIGTKVIADSVGYYVLDAYAAGTAKEQLGSDKADALALVTREDVIAAKPDLVKRMVTAHQKALAFITASTADALADTVLKNAKTAERDRGLSRSAVSILSAVSFRGLSSDGMARERRSTCQCASPVCLVNADGTVRNDAPASASAR